MSDAEVSMLVEIENAMETLRPHRKLMGFTLPLRRRALFTEAIEHVKNTKPEIYEAWQRWRQVQPYIDHSFKAPEQQ